MRWVEPTGCLLLVACAASAPLQKADIGFCGSSHRIMRNSEGDTLALHRLLGSWELELWREGSDRSVSGMVSLEPGRRSNEPGALHFHHMWYDAARGSFDLDLSPMLKYQPRVRVIHVLQRHDSVGAMIGATGSIIDEGDLSLEGYWHGDVIRGRWHQLGVVGCPSGSFELRRPAVEEIP